MKKPNLSFSFRPLTAVLAFAFAASPWLSAQPVPPGGQWELSGTISHKPSTSFRGSDDSIRSTRYSVGSSGRFALGEQGFLGLALRGSTVQNRWSPDAARFGDFRELDFGARWIRPLDDEWTFVGLAGMQMAAERGTSISSGDTYGIGGIVQYRMSPMLSFGLGALYNTRLDRSNRVLPLASIEWRISDHWQLTSANGVILRYDLAADGRHQFEGSILWSSVQFRATDADGQRFSVEEKGWRFSLAYHFRHASGLHLRPFVALNERRDFELRARDQRIDRFRTGVAPSFGLSAAWQF